PGERGLARIAAHALPIGPGLRLRGADRRTVGCFAWRSHLASGVGASRGGVGMAPEEERARGARRGLPGGIRHGKLALRSHRLSRWAGAGGPSCMASRANHWGGGWRGANRRAGRESARLGGAI